jgi:hypothetical protein
MHANLPEIAQRWEQEYSNGGIMRLGYRYGGDTMGGPNDRSSKGIRGPAGGSSAGGNYGGNRNPSQPGITGGKSPSAFTDVTKDVLNPQEDFVGETRFGPTQKYTGRSPWFGGANKYGYTDQYVNPTKSNFGDLKPGYGGRILGGLASMAMGIPFIGSALGSMYDKGKGIFSKQPIDMSQYNQKGLFSPSINPNSYNDFGNEYLELLAEQEIINEDGDTYEEALSKGTFDGSQEEFTDIYEGGMYA